MTENEAFIQAIVASPDDDHRRLIYADWLDERGDPRGEFIRVQFAREELPADSRDHVELLVREKLLLAKHEKDWLGPLQMPGAEWQFRRGFVEGGTVLLDDFLKDGETLIRGAPLRYLRFITSTSSRDPFREVDLKRLELLARSPLLTRLSGIELSNLGLEDPGLEVLVQSPQVQGLKELDLESNRITSTGIRSLTNSPHLQQLQKLTLSFNPIGDLGLQLLAGSPHLPALEHLALAHCQIRADGLQTLATSPLIGRLVSLDLDDNGIGNTGARALARSARLARLTSLSLRNSHLNDIGVESLVASPALRRLESLDLKGNHVSDRGAAALCQSSMHSLKELILGWRLSSELETRLQERFGPAVHL